MTTATATPWAAYDEKLNARFRGETQRFELASWSQPGQSDASYRKWLKESAKAQGELDGLQAHLHSLKQQSDAAVARHAEICGPLQEKLAGDCSTQERIDARVQINKANADLEATLESLKEPIAATESEIEYIRPRAGAKTQIENAAACSGTVADMERGRVLKLAIAELEMFLLDRFERKLREAELQAAKHQTDELQSMARVYAGVLQLLQSARNSWVSEQNEIRQRRLRELYSAE